jgi:hypothetical protein
VYSNVCDYITDLKIQGDEGLEFIITNRPKTDNSGHVGTYARSQLLLSECDYSCHAGFVFVFACISRRKETNFNTYCYPIIVISTEIFPHQV